MQPIYPSRQQHSRCHNMTPPSRRFSSRPVDVVHVNYSSSSWVSLRNPLKVMQHVDGDVHSRSPSAGEVGGVGTGQVTPNMPQG